MFIASRLQKNSIERARCTGQPNVFGQQQRDLPLLAHERRAARRTAPVGSIDGHAIGAALDDGDDVGDDLARLLEQHAIADGDVEPRDLVVVEERRALDGRARQLDRLEVAERRDRAGAPDVLLELEQLRRRLLARGTCRRSPSAARAWSRRAARRCGDARRP